MYYIARLLSFLILFAIFLLILKLLKFGIIKKDKNPEFFEKFANDKKFRRKQRIIYIFVALTFVAIIFICRYPFEGYFITFDTVEDSLSYKGISTEDITIYEYDDCTFVVSEDYSIYSITKVNQKYKLVDFKSDNIKYIQYKISGNEYVSNPISAKFNKEINKVFYYIGIETNSKPENGVMLDGNTMTFCTNATTNRLIKYYQREYWIYSYVDNAPPKSNFIITADDFEAEIYKTP